MAAQKAKPETVKAAHEGFGTIAAVLNATANLPLSLNDINRAMTAIKAGLPEVKSDG